MSPALGHNPPRPGPPVIPHPRPQYPNRTQAAGGVRVNALSTRSLSSSLRNDDLHSYEVCLQHHRNNNNSNSHFCVT